MEFKMSLNGDTLTKVKRIQKQLNHKKTQTTIRFIIDTYKLE